MICPRSITASSHAPPATPLRLALESRRTRPPRVSPSPTASLGPGVTAALGGPARRAGQPEPHAGEHLGLLERAYRPEATMAEAFAEVLAAVFADEGLVFLDPRDPRLAPLAAPIHRRALEEAPAISTALAGPG